MFALGCYHVATRRDEDSLEKSVEHFKQAWAKGLDEAAVALAVAYDYGDLGMVDRLRSRVLLGDVLGRECEYAAEYQIKKMIYGQHGVPADPKKALERCEELIVADTARYGEEEVNPKWYYYKGTAEQIVCGWTHGLEAFRRAADAGLVAAWTDIAIALSHDDRGEMVDEAAYQTAIREGAAKRDAFCGWLLALWRVKDFEKMSKYNQWRASCRLKTDLEKALKMGSNSAAEELGDLCYYGNYGISEDNGAAFKYYARGALLGSASCYEKMFGMIRDGYVDRPQEFGDMVALFGVRNGSEQLLEETVAAYRSGRLTEYAAEIEQYYVPVSEKKSGGNEKEDAVDDDGRFDAYA